MSADKRRSRFKTHPQGEGGGNLFFSVFSAPSIKTGLAFFAPLIVSPKVLAAAGGTPPDPVGIGGLLQVILALGFILALIAGLAFIMRRFGAVPQGVAGQLRVLGGVALGQRERAVLLQVGEKQLLIGVAPGQIRTLHVLEKPIVISPAAKSDDSFAGRLAAAMRRGEKNP